MARGHGTSSGLPGVVERMPAPSPLAGILLGLTVGWIGFRAMRSIDEYNLEVMISLAIVVGGNSLAGWLHVSGPVAMAVAGLLIGNAGVTLAMRM